MQQCTINDEDSNLGFLVNSDLDLEPGFFYHN
jgi:hypothetical protein